MLESSAPRPLLHGFQDFLVDRRVAISFATFSCLIVQRLWLGSPGRQVAGLDDPRGVLAGILVVAGVGLRSWAAGTLRKGKALTTTGPYRLCRHPLYLGSLITMIGFFVLLPGVQFAWLTLAPIAVIYTCTMLREERRLAVRYGEEWANYLAGTPRLLPTRFPWRLGGQWSFAQWSRSREYNALFTSLLIFALLQAWHRF